MTQAPVAQFMAQNGNNLFSLALLKQGIVDNNMLLPWQSEEIGVAMGASFTSINNVQLGERELKLLGQVLDGGLQDAGFKRGELVEQGKNGNWVDSDGKQLDKDSKHPKIVEEAVASSLYDFQDRADDGSSENDSQHLAFEHVHNPELDGLLVEAKLLFQDKGAIVRGREGQYRCNDVENKDKQQGMSDLPSEAFGGIFREQKTSCSPYFWENVAVDECQVLDLAV